MNPVRDMCDLITEVAAIHDLHKAARVRKKNAVLVMHS